MFFMTLIPSVECPYVEKPVRYTLHVQTPVERPIRQMYQRKVTRVTHQTRNVLHYLIKMK